MEPETSKKLGSGQVWVAIAISLFASVAFYFSTNPTLHDLDYTFEIASAFLRGDLGLREKPPEWLNEMVPYGDKYYSAFPLGAVLSMVPVALLEKASLVHDFPARILAALIAGACVYFFFQLAKAFGPDYSSLKAKPLGRRIYSRCSQYLELGPGVTSAWAVRGKSLSVSRYWEKPQLSISRWCDRRRSSPGRSSLLPLEIGPSFSSQHLFTSIFSGVAL